MDPRLEQAFDQLFIQWPSSTRVFDLGPAIPMKPIKKGHRTIQLKNQPKYAYILFWTVVAKILERTW